MHEYERKSKGKYKGRGNGRVEVLGAGWGRTGCGTRGHSFISPPPHLSVMGLLNSQGAGDRDTTSLLLPSALLFWRKGVKSSQRLKDRTQ